MKQLLIENLQKNYQKYVCIIENLKNSSYETLYLSETAVAFVIKPSNILMVAGTDEDVANAVNKVDKAYAVTFTPNEKAKTLLFNKFNLKVVDCYQYEYDKYNIDSELLSLKKLNASSENVKLICENYTLSYSEEEVYSLLNDKFILGGYINGKICSFIGMHEERSIGLLEVFKEYRRKGIGEFMVKKAVNYFIDNGYTPFSHVRCDNLPSINMQIKLNAKKYENKVFWLVNN